jgi:hypothetical protein
VIGEARCNKNVLVWEAMLKFVAVCLKLEVKNVMTSIGSGVGADDSAMVPRIRIVAKIEGKFES